VMQLFCKTVCPKYRADYHLLPLPSGADEVSGKSWQLVTSLHGEGDGLIFCG
jgi:hypothetical protein